MSYRIGILVGCMLIGLLAAPAEGHFHMFLPEAAATKRGQVVELTYRWGHPFEHQLFEASLPESLAVLSPDGKRTDLLKKLEKADEEVSGQQKAAVYRLRFVPEVRGDYVFVLKAPPIWMEAEQEFLQDTVKVVLHVQAQKGWDAEGDKNLDIVPLTRPYGLQAGMVFQGRALADGQSLGGALVEIEKYNARPPAELPADEHITRTVKTDPNGVFTGTLTEPGWWALTVSRNAGQREHQGKKYPLRQRATFWVSVDEKAALKTEK